MAVKVNKTYSTDKITLRYTATFSASLWELGIGNESICFSQETFEELKAIMAEVLYGTAKNS
jgi:hypothetical protein